MKLSVTREASSGEATRKLPGIYWNPKVHYSIHTTPSYPSKNHFNIIHPPTT
jgi:hypothetical protein